MFECNGMSRINEVDSMYIYRRLNFKFAVDKKHDIQTFCDTLRLHLLAIISDHRNVTLIWKLVQTPLK